MVQQLIEGFSKQLTKGIKVGQGLRFVPANREIRNVVVGGLGGSGIGATLVESLVFNQMPVPMTVVKSYEVPAFVNQNTLFIASSFSGNTEETLEAVGKALAQGAVVACITSGGKLLQLAQDKGLTVAQLPDEAPSPRAFLGYNFIQVLFLLQNYGLINNAFIGQIEKAAALLDERQELIKEGARDLAEALHGKLPMLYGDAKLYPVLVRFQQQINENSKQLAHVNVFPELNHNELVGWVNPKEIVDKTVVVLVHTEYDHPRVRMRMDVCRPIFAQKADKLVEVLARYGDSLLEQCVYLVHLFDWASFYLAEQNGADAFEIRVIDHLKSELSKQ